MSKQLKIGIVGCGAIGTSLAEAIVGDFRRQARLTSLYDISRQRSLSLSRKLKLSPSVVAHSLNRLIDGSDLVIEAAAAQACLAIAIKVLNKRRNIMIMSVGGIVNHLGQLISLARKNQAKVYIPSGAICGIDALRAAAQKKIKRVLLITRKNPKSFEGLDYIKRRGIELKKIKREKVLFSGSAQRAIRLFPQNINIAAILSIAGIGPRKTKVKLIASKQVSKNIHELRIDSEAAKISARVENLLHPDNPKTSFLAVLSAIATLRQILEPVKVGT